MRTRTDTNKKIQTAFRLDNVLLSRLKEAALQNNTSVNNYVTIILTDATKDIVTPEEMEEKKRLTRAFLSQVAGSWEGTESAEEIIKSIKEENKPKEIVSL